MLRCRLLPLGAACVLATLFPGLIRAETIVEDFTQNGAPGFDPRFVHSVESTLLASFWEITDQQSKATPGNHELFLAPATDEVTYRLTGGQFIDFASVVLTDYAGMGGTTVTFTGTKGANPRTSITFSNTAVSTPTLFSTQGQLDRVESITLTSFEGTFDNLTVNVIPEPSAALLAILAGLGFVTVAGLRRFATRP